MPSVTLKLDYGLILICVILTYFPLHHVTASIQGLSEDAISVLKQIY